MKENCSSFTAYSKLIKDTDKVTATLNRKHQTHMQCRAGCDLCCMSYSISPLEFHYILHQLQKEKFQKSTLAHNNDSEKCIFLKNGICTIYHHRPMICRTHGLPLLYTNDTYEWELSTCELNFREFDYEKFTPDNTFSQDKFNSRLFMLNKQFTSEFREKKYSETDRIPIQELENKL